jgi:hypothetical protein
MKKSARRKRGGQPQCEDLDVQRDNCECQWREQGIAWVTKESGDVDAPIQSHLDGQVATIERLTTERTAWGGELVGW